MGLEKTERVNELLDCYGELLTSNQLDVLELYYKEDLSFKEIADNLGVSRNAVFDTLKRSVIILEDYESKLHLKEKEDLMIELLDKYDELTKEEIKEYILKL